MDLTLLLTILAGVLPLVDAGMTEHTLSTGRFNEKNPIMKNNTIRRLTIPLEPIPAIILYIASKYSDVTKITSLFGLGTITAFYSYIIGNNIKEYIKDYRNRKIK